MKGSIEMAEATSRLAGALRSGRPAITAECVPVGARDADDVRRLAAAFPPFLDALVVSGNEGQGISTVVFSALLAEQGLEPVLTVLTRDRNRIALLSDVLGAGALGVRNVLCLPGDHQSLGSQPEAAGAYDVDPVQLIQLLNERQDDGHDSLFIGAEAYPHLRPLELSMIDVRKKIGAGARFLLTRPVFDMASFEEWMGTVRLEGLHERVDIIASVQPLTGADQAESIAACVETMSALKSVAGVRGVHIMGNGTPDVAAAVIARAGLAPA